MNAKYLSTVAAFFMVSSAFAAGLSSGTSVVRDFVTWFYGLVGAGAGGYLLWKGLESWSGRSDWLEFLKACGQVAVTGGALVLAGWLWTVFS